MKQAKIEPYFQATNEPASIIRFALMGTLLIIWEPLVKDLRISIELKDTDIKALISYYMANGIVCIVKNNKEEAQKFLYSNTELKSSKHFKYEKLHQLNLHLRILVNRHLKDLVFSLRDKKYNCPILVYTQKAYVAQLTDVFRTSRKIFVEYEAEAARNFIDEE